MILNKNINSIFIILLVIIIIFYISNNKIIISNNHKHNNGEEFENNLINNDTYNIYLFYSKTCKHSMKLIPTWIKLKKIKNTNIKLLSIENSESNVDLFKKYNITRIPTIILQNNSKTDFHTYFGDNSLSDIISFLKKNGLVFEESYLENFENNNDNDNDNDNCINTKLYRSQNQINTFCINNKNIRGCVSEDNFPSKSSFNAAYSIVSTNLDQYNNESDMLKCLKNNKNDIKNFGLCDDFRLKKMEFNEDNKKFSKIISNVCKM